jgi:ribose-phosphate pyrophosphokinase
MIDVNKLEFKNFPGGELHITDSWIKDGTILQDNTVLCRIQNTNDFMKLCLFTNAFKNFVGRMPSRLVLPYIPYARQDRITNPGEALSIKVFANLLNTLNYRSVYVLDPHSDVCTALIENVKIIPQWEIFADAVPEDVDLIAPDAGALKKVYKLQEAVRKRGIEVPVRIATKHRDTHTGKVSHTTIEGNPVNKTCVVIDDICDTGGTLLALANILEEQYEKRILMVTHGIFSKGIAKLSIAYNRILSTNSFSELKPEGNLRVISIEKMF